MDVQMVVVSDDAKVAMWVVVTGALMAECSAADSVGSLA